MHFKTLSILTLALLTVSGFAGMPVSAQNLVTNPGFETGNFTGWTITPFGDLTVVANNVPATHTPPSSGQFEARFASSDPNDDVLSQTLSTMVGQTYNFSFWLANVDGTSNDFKASFGQSQLLDLKNSGDFAYKNYAFTVMATSTSTVVSFSGRQPPGAFYLDDVSVAAAAPVPEASCSVSLGLLLLLGVGGVAISRRRRAGTAR